MQGFITKMDYLVYKIIPLICILMVVGTSARFLTNNVDETDEFDTNDAPPYKNYAQMARYIVHKSTWGGMGSISTLKAIQGYPMVNVISIADSPAGAKSTGRIYFFLTRLDFTGQDLLKDNKLTLLLSMDQDLSCSSKNVDPMEPTCARIMITGKANSLEVGSEDYKFGNKSMYSRHPASASWNREHNFFLCQLEIEQIAVLDFYGGPHFVEPEEYYQANDESFDLGVESKELDGFESNDLAMPEPHESDNGFERELHVKLRRDSRIKLISIEEV